jgi:putative DNA primase/helicase
VFHQAREFTRAIRAGLPKEPRSLTKVAFASAVERATRADPKIAVSQEVWDCDPWLLGTPDGVVDLKTGQALSPKPDRYNARHTSVAPAPPGTGLARLSRQRDTAGPRAPKVLAAARWLQADRRRI